MSNLVNTKLWGWLKGGLGPQCPLDLALGIHECCIQIHKHFVFSMTILRINYQLWVCL